MIRSFFLRNHVLQLLSDLRIVKIHNQIFEHVIQWWHIKPVECSPRIFFQKFVTGRRLHHKSTKCLWSYVNQFLSSFLQQQSFYFQPFITYELSFDNMRDEISLARTQHHEWENLKVRDQIKYNSEFRFAWK